MKLYISPGTNLIYIPSSALEIMLRPSCLQIHLNRQDKLISIHSSDQSSAGEYMIPDRIYEERYRGVVLFKEKTDEEFEYFHLNDLPSTGVLEAEPFYYSKRRQMIVHYDWIRPSCDILDRGAYAVIGAEIRNESARKIKAGQI